MSFDKPIKINGRTWEHVLAAVQRVEAMPYPSRQPAYFPRFPAGGGVFDAISTSAITAFNTSSNTYGSGTCTITKATFDSNTNTYIRSDDPAYSSDLTVLSTSTTNSGVDYGVNIGVTFRNGVLLLCFVDCGN